MSTQKKNTRKGFTLVEVIVVAVIVAILAAVAIPIYQQYVLDSRNNAAQNVGGSAASFAGACGTRGEGITIVNGTLTGPGSITCAATTTISMIIPQNISVASSAPAATTGTITSQHLVGPGTAYTFNY